MKKISKIQATLTAIGIMIGCGIYFKADDIVQAVNGNIVVSIFIWLFITIGFMFAGVSAAGLAQKLNPDGGMVGYFEQFFGKKFAFFVGWFEFFVYSPVLVSILSSVVCKYFLMLFNVSNNFVQFVCSILLVIFMYFWNYFSVKIATLISVCSTYIKVIPLIIISILGFFLGDVSHLSMQEVMHSTGTTINFLAPFIIIAFLFDGWVNVGSLAIDMKNPQKDLPFVYIVSLLVTCIVYFLYFLGVNLLLDANQIVQLGDEHLYYISQNILGNNGAKVILIFVIISGIGTMNAMFMSGTRYVEKLADDNLIFKAKWLSKRTKYDTPARSALPVIIISLILCFLIYIQNFDIPIIKNIVFENAAICINSFFTGVLFIINIILFSKKQLNLFQGLIAPIIAIITYIIIVISYFFTSVKIFVTLMPIIIILLILFIAYITNKEELKAFK